MHNEGLNRFMRLDPLNNTGTRGTKNWVGIGMIRATSEKIIPHGTDWRLLNQLKKELKARSACRIGPVFVNMSAPTDQLV